jgi:GNAT superfamily N-acetyltransferase
VDLTDLRDATDEDSWPLIALISACWAEYPGCVTDVAREYPELLAPASHSRDHAGALWVVPEGAWVAACVGLSADGGNGREKTMELVKLYVAPHRRRQGLGQTLVKWVEQQALARGATGIDLWSDTRFGSAHRLYERLGYAPTGATRDLHDLSQTTEFAFHKPLPAAATTGG